MTASDKMKKECIVRSADLCTISDIVQCVKH